MPLNIIQPITYGAHPGTIAGFETTGGFTVFAGDSAGTFVGVSDVLAGFARSAGNSVHAEGVEDTAIGDALTVTDFARGGNNTVLAESKGQADAAGDANILAGFAQAGHNTVTAMSSDGPANAFGDAYLMTGFARGGENTVTALIGLGGSANLYGDAHTLSGLASGGHNTLTGSAPGAPETTFAMYGDAYELTDAAHGGGNLLTSPGYPVIHPVTMYGDGYELLGFASGGDNTLVAGQHVDDIMWGDAAIVSPVAHTSANTFVFNQGIGHDTIMDFRAGEDHIDLQGFGISNFQALSQLFHTTANGLDIVFSASSDILLHGVSQVAAGSFVFS